MTGSLYLSGYDILPADFTQVPLNLEDDVTKLRADAWKFARQDSRVNINPTSVGIQGQRAIQYDMLELMYDAQQGNTFTKENLKLIHDVEIEIFNNSIYQQRLCQVTESGLCKLPLSIIRFFDGSYRSIHPDLFDPKFENITRILNLANSMNLTRAMLDFHLDKHAVIHSASDVPVQSRYTRSLFYIGYPLKGFHNTEDRVDKQWDEAQSFASEAFAKLLDKKFKQGIGAMKFYYFLRALFFNAISQQVIYDLLLAGASFTFIFLFMLFQTQSLWITGWAVFSILTCFFGANLIYRLILDCRYIGIFHVLSVFIILGIGADDVFVFIDTWKSSESMAFRDMAARMSFVYRRAASAMFTTSFTTMVAFVTSVFSPLLGVSTFGIFSALLVFVNFCSVIIFFPTVIITYEYHWKAYRWHCFGDLKAWQAITSRREDIIQGDGPEQQQREKFVEPSKVVSNFLESRFFDNFIAHRTIRWIILGTFFIFLCVSIGFATQLTPDEEPVSVVFHLTRLRSVQSTRLNNLVPMLAIISLGTNCDCYIRCCYVSVHLLNSVVFVGPHSGSAGLVLSTLRFEMKRLKTRSWLGKNCGQCFHKKN